MTFLFSLPEISRIICEFLRKDFLFCERLKFGEMTFFSFGEQLRVESLGLGLEHSYSWPRGGFSSESRSLASGFFCVFGLGLKPYVLDFTSAKISYEKSRGLLRVQDYTSNLCPRAAEFEIAGWKLYRSNLGKKTLQTCSENLFFFC